jgi:nicotinamide phosphoribosyltransferase
MININPFFLTDGYKTGHHKMYPEGTQLVYSNFTPRSNKYAPKGCNKVVSFGQRMVMKYIQDVFQQGFFDRDKEEVLEEIRSEYSQYLGAEYNVDHIAALWDRQYLPIKVKALPEGTTVPMGVPVLTIYNTGAEFYWLTNFLETIISTLLWKPMTSATIGHHFYKNIINKYAKETDKDNPAVKYLAHDFSMRGMDAPFAVMASGLGHALSFDGSDSLPVIPAARYYYNAKGNIVNSVNATEHSVMCAGTKEDEIGTFRYLMKQFPKGILSIVSDTWDLWKVLTVILPALKEEILKRDGKIVIRPDSGDPVDIICGTHHEALGETAKTPEQRGVVGLLWDVFGGTINAQGYKVLDPHIGAIYGDSINAERAVQICERLKAKGFASTNVVLGIGSFTYQYNTRDTFGFAMKATYCEVFNQCERPCGPQCEEEGRCGNMHVEAREIFKDPITDDGTKKSAKGLLQVYRLRGAHGLSEYKLKDQCTWKEEQEGELKTIYQDGHFNNATTLEQIKQRLSKEC